MSEMVERVEKAMFEEAKARRESTQNATWRDLAKVAIEEMKRCDPNTATADSSSEHNQRDDQRRGQESGGTEENVVQHSLSPPKETTNSAVD